MNLVGTTFDVGFVIDAHSQSRKAALWKLAKHIEELRPDTATGKLAKCLHDRERLGSTAIGAGVAIPHAVLHDHSPPLILATRLEQKLDFGALDGSGVDILLAVVGNRKDLLFLQAVMPRICKLVQDRALLGELRSATNIEEVQRVLACLGLATTN